MLHYEEEEEIFVFYIQRIALSLLNTSDLRQIYQSEGDRVIIFPCRSQSDTPTWMYKLSLPLANLYRSLLLLPLVT